MSVDVEAVKLAIENRIYTRQPLIVLIDEVWFEEADEDAAFPLIVYDFTGPGFMAGDFTHTTENPLLDISIWAEDTDTKKAYEIADQIGLELSKVFDDRPLPVEGYKSVSCKREGGFPLPLTDDSQAKRKGWLFQYRLVITKLRERYANRVRVG